MGLLYGMRTLTFLGYASMNFVALRRGRQYHNMLVKMGGQSAYNSDLCDTRG